MRVLFVCSGNVFRSLAAEYCLNDYAKKNDLNVTASSAGIHAAPHPIHPAVIGALNEYGIEVNHHHQRRLTKEIIDESDVVIAMAKNHKKFIRECFGIRAPLFNELVNGDDKPILDHYEVLFDNNLFSDEVILYLRSVVKHIHDSIPGLIESLKN